MSNGSDTPGADYGGNRYFSTNTGQHYTSPTQAYAADYAASISSQSGFTPSSQGPESSGSSAVTPPPPQIGDPLSPDPPPNPEIASGPPNNIDKQVPLIQASSWKPVPNFPDWWFRFDRGAGGGDVDHYHFGKGKDPKSPKFKEILRRIKRKLSGEDDDDDDFKQNPHGSNGLDQDVPAEVVKAALGIKDDCIAVDLAKIQALQPETLTGLLSGITFLVANHNKVLPSIKQGFDRIGSKMNRVFTTGTTASKYIEAPPPVIPPPPAWLLMLAF